MRNSLIFTFVLALLPTIIGISTPLFFDDSTVKEYLITFFTEKLSTDRSTVVLIVYLFLLWLAQMLSGYAFNRISPQPPPETNFKRFLTYIYNRVMLLTYAIYEFFAIYILVLLVFGFFLTEVDLQKNRISSNFLEMILYTIAIILMIGLLFKITADAFLKKHYKHKYLGMVKIDQESTAGNLILDLQTQFCNIAFLLILPLTLISVFSEGVGDSERALFLGLTSLVVACYIFLMMKSKLFDFIMKPIK